MKVELIYVCRRDREGLFLVALSQLKAIQLHFLKIDADKFSSTFLNPIARNSSISILDWKTLSYCRERRCQTVPPSEIGGLSDEGISILYMRLIASILFPPREEAQENHHSIIESFHFLCPRRRQRPNKRSESDQRKAQSCPQIRA